MSRELGWSDDGVSLLGRSYEKTEHVFARVGIGFVVLFVCSVLVLGAVAVGVESESPTGVVRIVAIAALAGLTASVAGLGFTCLSFGCWSYWHSRSVRTTLDGSVESPFRNPLWLVSIAFRSEEDLDEYEWWVRRAVRWSAFGLVWLVPVARVGLDALQRSAWL